MGNANSSRWPKPVVVPPADATPLPSLIFMLMVGSSPSYRVPGWAMVMQSGDEAIERRLVSVWAEHGTELTLEARAHGFTPYWVTKKMPIGPGVKRWRDRFRSQHGY